MPEMARTLKLTWAASYIRLLDESGSVVKQKAQQQTNKHLIE